MASPMSDEDSFDSILIYCHRHRLSIDPAGGDSISIGKFQFTVHPHSTGNAVEGFIVTSEGLYEFLNGTWWFSSDFTFNDFKWEHGAWDSALTQAMNQLRGLVIEHKYQAFQASQAEKDARELLARLRKSEVEKQFV